MASPKKSSDALRDFLDDSAGHNADGVTRRDADGTGSPVSSDANGDRGGVVADHGRVSDPPVGDGALVSPAAAANQPNAAAARSAAGRAADRPAAAAARARRPNTAEEAEHLAALIEMLHGLVARKTGVAEFAMSKEDATALATAIQDVRSLYKKGKVSSKSSAWFSLFVVVLVLYIPIFMALRARAQEANEEPAVAA